MVHFPPQLGSADVTMTHTLSNSTTHDGWMLDKPHALRSSMSFSTHTYVHVVLMAMKWRLDTCLEDRKLRKSWEICYASTASLPSSPAKTTMNATELRAQLIKYCPRDKKNPDSTKVFTAHNNYSRLTDCCVKLNEKLTPC